MGPAGTELRVQECREGRLLPRLATRRQEVRHPAESAGDRGKECQGKLVGRGCTDSTTERGGRGVRQRERNGDRDQHLQPEASWLSRELLKW